MGRCFITSGHYYAIQFITVIVYKYMGTSPSNRDERQVPPKSSSTVILMTLADTTWRLFVPSVGLTLVGLWLDKMWHTTPWLLFTGIIVGSVIAVYSVAVLIKRIDKL